MEIADYELFEVPPRWQFLKIETASGAVGWGEPIVEGRTASTRAAVEELMDTYLVGADAHRIEDHWQNMYRSGFYRGGPVLMSAMSGIDQALWDLKGKQFGAPVYELLGGRVRDRMRIYGSLGAADADSPGESARELVDRGYTAFKTVPTPRMQHVHPPAVLEQAREKMSEMRAAVGNEIDIALDFHGRASKSMAKRLAGALEEFDPMFYEEPVRAEHNDALPGVAAHTTIPIATGERMYGRCEFKPLLESGAADIIQPDVSHAGGITELKKIAAMADAYDVALAPHCPLGPITFASSIQVDACASNALIQEQSDAIYQPDVEDYLTDPSVLEYDDEGYVPLPESPGLGIEIDEQAVRAAAEEHEPAPLRPARRLEDGSIAEL